MNVITQAAFCVFFILITTAGTIVKADTFNIRDYGAVGDNRSNNAAAIQAAVDACSEAGGGTVLIPPGIYLSGSIVLKSHVSLFLEAGAVLQGSADLKDYVALDNYDKLAVDKTTAWPALIIANQAEHIGIRGQGIIRGTGESDLGRRPLPPGQKNDGRPPNNERLGVVHLRDCKQVQIQDITIQYSDFWTIHLWNCETVFVDGVTILNNYFRTNSDGIDVCSSRNVHISNCHIVAGDDAICLKASNGIPCEDVMVSNCTLESVATAVKLGTGSNGDFRNIHMSNLSIRNSHIGIGFFLKDGGTMERITIANASIETSEKVRIKESMVHNIAPIYIDQERRREEQHEAGKIRDVTLRDVYVTTRNSSVIQGMPGTPIENLTLENICFRVNGDWDFSKRKKDKGGTSFTHDERDTLFMRQPSYLTIAHVDGLSMNKIRVEMDSTVDTDRSAVSIHESSNLRIRDVQLQRGRRHFRKPVLNLVNVRDALISGSSVLPETPVFLRLSGNSTEGVILSGNDLRHARKAVQKDDDVDGEVTIVP